MKYLVIAVFFSGALFSCSEECHECHYEVNGTEVVLGDYCGDDLEAIEADGFVDSTGTNHEVHCFDH